MTAYLKGQFAAYDLELYGELVLGCTHFNYFKDTFRRLMPDQVHIIDGSLGAVRQLARVLDARGQLAAPIAEDIERLAWNKNDTSVRYFTSGREMTDADQLKKIQALHERLERMRKIF